MRDRYVLFFLETKNPILLFAGVPACIIRTRHREPPPLPRPPQGAQSWPRQASLLLHQHPRYRYRASTQLGQSLDLVLSLTINSCQEVTHALSSFPLMVTVIFHKLNIKLPIFWLFKS